MAMENPWKIHCKMEDMEVLICFHGIFNVKMEDMEVLISFHGFFYVKMVGFPLPCCMRISAVWKHQTRYARCSTSEETIPEFQQK